MLVVLTSGQQGCIRYDLQSLAIRAKTNGRGDPNTIRSVIQIHPAAGHAHRIYGLVEYPFQYRVRCYILLIIGNRPINYARTTEIRPTSCGESCRRSNRWIARHICQNGHLFGHLAEVIQRTQTLIAQDSIVFTELCIKTLTIIIIEHQRIHALIKTHRVLGIYTHTRLTIRWTNGNHCRLTIIFHPIRRSGEISTITPGDISIRISYIRCLKVILLTCFQQPVRGNSDNTATAIEVGTTGHINPAIGNIADMYRGIAQSGSIQFFIKAHMNHRIERYIAHIIAGKVGRDIRP